MKAECVGALIEPVHERELVLRCRSGSDPHHAAFKALYERHAPELRRFLCSMLADATSADDALQETFVRAYRGLAQFDAARPLRPWLLAIARHAAIEVLRQRQRAVKQRALGDEDVPAAPGPDRVERRESRELVHAAVEALSPEHREVVLLRLAHGLKLNDVAAALEVTERTVRNRLRAAAVLLERELRRRGLDPRGGAP